MDDDPAGIIVRGLGMESVANLLTTAQNHLRAGHVEEAAALYGRVVELEPMNAAALHQLGVLLHGKGQSSEAEQLLARAAIAAPTNDLYRNNLGVLQEARGDFEAAASSYAAALGINPRRARVHFNLGNALRSLGRLDEALAAFQQALALEPEYGEALHNLGALLKELGRYEEAAVCLQRAVAAAPDLVDAWVNLGSALQALEGENEAREAYQRALDLQPGYPDAVAGLASVRLRSGEKEEAARLLIPLLPAEATHPEVATVFAGLARHLGREKECVAILEQVLADPGLLRSKRQTLLFSLGKLLDNLDQYDEAFARFAEAHALQARAFDFTQFADWITRIAATFTADFLSSAPRSGVHSEVPVFIVGMPRSGTSLVEQILASHPLVFGAGELPHIDRLAQSLPNRAGLTGVYPESIRTASAGTLTAAATEYLASLRQLAPQAQRVVDKMPGNFAHLGFLALLFPQARIIHIRREPLDTCLSCYFQHFSTGHEYASDLTMLGRVYLEYERLMEHWRQVLPSPMLEVQYEMLVKEPERETRRLLEFCGLEWDERCLRFYENRRMVRTASFDQVRQPLYTRSIEKHRCYKRFLGPLKEVLTRPQPQPVQ
ncbi:sulfotransferase [Verrucomicrobiota bacterium sgz303538]